MKVYMFAGREHHYLKLLPLYESLTVLGHFAGFIISNNSINIDPPEEFLANADVNYLHLHDVINNPMDLYRSRTEIYNDLTGIDRYSWHVPPFWKYSSLLEMYETRSAIDTLLSNGELRPDVFIGLHENNFWVKNIAHACMRHGVPHYVFQEGYLRDQDQETLNKQLLACEYSDKIFVWGESSKEKYIEAGVPESKIVVSGPMHLHKWGRKKRNLDGPFTVVYCVPLMQQYKGDFNKDWEKLSQFFKVNNINGVLRFHPMDNIDNPNLPIMQSTDPFPELLHADLVLSQHSTVALEAMALGIPMLEFNMSDTPILQSWADQGVTELISTEEDFSKMIDALIDYEFPNKEQQEYLNRELKMDENSVGIVIKKIVEEDEAYMASMMERNNENS